MNSAKSPTPQQLARCTAERFNPMALAEPDRKLEALFAKMNNEQDAEKKLVLAYQVAQSPCFSIRGLHLKALALSPTVENPDTDRKRLRGAFRHLQSAIDALNPSTE